MGEIADMILEGDMCACGNYIGDGDGYPQYCSPQCRRDYGGGEEIEAKPPPSKISCPDCGKRVKANGLADHQRVVHQIKE